MRAVVKGIKDPEELIRANERLTMVLEVEKAAEKLEELTEKVRVIQGTGI